MRHGGRVSALVVVVMAILSVGGCSLVTDAVTGRSKALVTAQEKEELGYERPAGVPNPRVQAKALKHRAEIFAVVKPFVEKALGGREVELVGIDARYPYNSVDVIYRSTSEPLVTSRAFVGLRGDGSVQGEASIAKIDPDEVKHMTVMGLYYMAYRDQILKMQNYLEVTYSQYTSLPEGYEEFHNLRHPCFAIHYNPDGYPDGNNEPAEDAVYAAYQQNPDRTDEQWRQVFEKYSSKATMSMTMFLVLRDPDTAPTEAMARTVGDDLRENPLFAAFTDWRISVLSNQMMRDDEEFHEVYIINTSLEPSGWRVEHTVDGGDVEP